MPGAQASAVKEIVQAHSPGVQGNDTKNKFPFLASYPESSHLNLTVTPFLRRGSGGPEGGLSLAERLHF